MKKLIASFLLLGAISSLTSPLQAQQSDIYTFDKKIPVPGDGWYDYLSIDQANRRLYVSHGTTVHVIDLHTEKVIGAIDHLKGVHGIAIVNDLNRGFISDGGANEVVVFDLKTLKTIATIPLSSKDPDAIVYDPYSKLVFTFNGQSNNATALHPGSLKEVGTIELGGTPEFAVADGRGRMYNNLEDQNSLVVIDTKALKVIKKYPLNPCGQPTGLALDEKDQRLFAGCRENKGLSVADAKSGKVIVTLPIGAGVDAVAYDPVTRLIFSSNGEGTTTIIRQSTADAYAVVQTLKTQNRARTMALDTKTHKIYLSVAHFENNGRKIVPGSFAVLVYRMK